MREDFFGKLGFSYLKKILNCSALVLCLNDLKYRQNHSVFCLPARCWAYRHAQSDIIAKVTTPTSKF